MDQTTQLRQLIRESIQEYIREVETSGNIAAQEAKIRACEEAIALREKKVNMEGLDEAYHDMMDSSKLNELKKEVKELQKYKAKAEKLLEKMKAKAEGKMAPKKMADEGMDEGTEEGMVDEVNLDEYTADPAAGPELEEGKKMTAAQKSKKEDIVKGMKKSKSFGKSKDEKGKMYATATKLATKESVESEDEVLNESFLHMQKLAGLITEGEFKQKMQMLSEIEVKVGNVYVYEHPKAGPVKVKALGESKWGDEYFVVESLEDKGEVKKGNQYNAEIEKLTVAESN